jgi:hypothetical protein
MKAAACVGTEVSGKLTLPPAPMVVVEVDDVDGGIVVVGEPVGAGW